MFMNLRTHNHKFRLLKIIYMVFVSQKVYMYIHRTYSSHIGIRFDTSSCRTNTGPGSACGLALPSPFHVFAIPIKIKR